MDDSHVRLIIHPSGGDDAAIAVADFLKQVGALKQLVALSRLNEEIDARIISMSKNSPAVVELEAFAARTQVSVGIERLFTDIKSVVDLGQVPHRVSRQALDILKEFSSAIGKGIAFAKLEFCGKEIFFDIEARRRLDDVFGDDTIADGSIDGMLEAVNIHSTVNTLALYPVVGPSRITCRFDDKLLSEVKPALGRYVVVYGEMKYRWKEMYPYEVSIRDIEILPDWEDQPKFTDILSIAPTATDGVKSEDFVKKIRDEWH
ncbi:hypothetical protein ACO2RV_12840 [Ancylobacter sp. VNQ12]|uniref:hypothetical protein n=1 Tax=Ancylobacter sp. VNQ12 TaxID=3400920 RepID=UPI003BFCD52B